MLLGLHEHAAWERPEDMAVFFREARPLLRQHLNSRVAAKFILRSWCYLWLHRAGSIGGSGRWREVCQAEERQGSEVSTLSSGMGREAEVQRSRQCWSPGLQEAYTAVHKSLWRPSSRRVHTWNIKVTFMLKTLMKNVCHFPSLYISPYTKYSVSPRCVVVTAYYLFRGYWWNKSLYVWYRCNLFMWRIIWSMDAEAVERGLAK